MLIDDFMPVYEFDATQTIKVSAAPEAVFAAFKTFKLGDSTTIRWMFKMRGIPTENVTIKDFAAVNFNILGETPNKEIVLGLAGKFQSLTDKLLNVAPADFADFSEPNLIKAVWNFAIVDAQTSVVSAIRISTADADARRKVEKSWPMMKPPLEMVRGEILKLIKKQAERTAK